jgi:long-chain acyl-CoA synthetase
MEKRQLVKVTRIFDSIPELLKKGNVADAFAGKENGTWIKYSTQQFAEYVNHLSYGLLNLGVTAQDKIAIISNNRPEWNFADFGVQQTGAVTVPIYPTISETDLEFILNDAQVKYIFVSSEELYKKVKEVAAKAPCVKEIYTFNKVAGAKNWMEVVESGKNNPKPNELEAAKKAIEPSDLLTILYTSGTTGNPKGVMLSHNNLLSNVYACENTLPDEIKTKEQWKVLSFLPLNHVYERMLMTAYILGGASVYYAESIDTIGANLQEVKPDGFASVPRIFEKVFEKIMATGATLTGFKRKVFDWSIELGFQYELEGKGWWYQKKLNIARKLVFSKWKDAVGGNLISSMSGGAALQPRLARIFSAAGIPILEGYGLTETSPVISTNSLHPNGMKFGTVGKVIEGVTVKIAQDGEILVKGPNVMMGYYNNPEATAEVIDNDGWFHTGDIGEIDKDGFLKITDRKKQIFKTSGGKYIAPTLIENKLHESPYIEQAMVIGEYQKYPSALIVPSFVKLKEWCAENGVSFTSNEEVIKNQKVKEFIVSEVEKVNTKLAQYEKIKQPELLAKEFTVEGGQLTPKLSYRRKNIIFEYKELIEKIYSSAK